MRISPISFKSNVKVLYDSTTRALLRQKQNDYGSLMNTGEDLRKIRDNGNNDDVLIYSNDGRSFILRVSKEEDNNRSFQTNRLLPHELFSDAYKEAKKHQKHIYNSSKDIQDDINEFII